MKTWHQEEKSTTTLPALIMLPDALKKSAEQMILKVWAESQELAEREINSQREALRQAESLANEKIAEAEAFSEEQAKKIEALEAHIEAIKKDRDEQHADWIKTIEKEQENRHQAIMEKAVCEQKLHENEKQFNYVNAALIEQQKTNQALTGENIKLKSEIENAEKIRVEVKNQINKSEEKTKKIEADNKKLAEKASMLEGELKAWKSIKPNEKKSKENNKAIHLPLKTQNKTETPTTAIQTEDVKDNA